MSSISCAPYRSRHPRKLRLADHRAVIAWGRYMREVEHAASSTIRRRLAALSSLYKHLVRHGHAPRNPVGEVERPAINREEGATAAFSKAQARKLLDLPGEDTIAGLRGRAIPLAIIVGMFSISYFSFTMWTIVQSYRRLHDHDPLKFIVTIGDRDFRVDLHDLELLKQQLKVRG